MHHNDYMYAINRSNEYLAHYGIKGMKWGVRKAIERGDRAAISRHYLKAHRKLEKLTERARTGKGIGVKRSLAGGAASALSSAVGTYALNRVMGSNPVSALKMAGIAGLAGGAAGAIANSGRATRAEKLRAAMKRDRWKREMDRTFKGTSHIRSSSASNERSKMSTKEFADGMRKSATRGGLAGGFALGPVGSSIGSAISTTKYIRQNPEAYKAYKKKFKQASFKDRMKMAYGIR